MAIIFPQTASLTLRLVQGTPLTYQQMDDNWIALRNVDQQIIDVVTSSAFVNESNTFTLPQTFLSNVGISSSLFGTIASFNNRVFSTYNGVGFVGTASWALNTVGGSAGSVGTLEQVTSLGNTTNQGVDITAGDLTVKGINVSSSIADLYTGSINTTNFNNFTSSYIIDSASWNSKIADLYTGSVDVSIYLSSSWTGSKTSQFSGTSSYALTASYVLGTSSFAETSSYTLTSSISISSSYTETSSISISSSYASTASYVDITGSGILVNYNGSQIQLTGSLASTDTLQDVTTRGNFTSGSIIATGSAVGFVGTASWAESSSYTLSSSYADTASYIETASYAIQALSASYAISSSYEINYETSSSYADTASIAISSSYALTASYIESASYALTSSYANTASVAISSSYALTASFVKSSSYAITSSYTDTASYAFYAVSASYEINYETSSSYADTASIAISSSYAVTASYAETSSYAITASYVESSSYALTSSHAITASYVESSSYSFSSSYALTSSYSISSSLAETASFVESSSYALTSSYATTASYVESSSYALSSSYAFSSSYALSSSYAITASYAETSSWSINTLTSQNTIITGKNLETTTIAKGTPLYFTDSGTSGNLVGVYAADASNPARMPAAGVAGENIAPGAEGIILLNGFINEVNTSLFGAGDEVYVAVGGGYTNQRPTGTALVQTLGYVEKSAINGSGVIQGPGHHWDLPNIQPGFFWVGDSNSYPQAVATSSMTASVSISSSYAFQATTASFAVTASYSIYNFITSSVTSSISSSYSDYAVTASYVKNAETASYVDITGSGILVNYNGSQIQLTASAGAVPNLQAVTDVGNQTTNDILITGSLSNGTNAFASGFYSHAEGTGTQAVGTYTHAEGELTRAQGQGSHAEGYSSTAVGFNSHAEGLHTIATSPYQHTQGQYNLEVAGNSAFVVGNGTSDASRSNLIYAQGNTVQVTGSVDITGGYLINGVQVLRTLSYVAAHLNVSGQSLNDAVDTTIGNWNTSAASGYYDNKGAFNATSGVFTCPADGLYYVTAGFLLNPGNNPANSIYQLTILKQGPGGINAVAFNSGNLLQSTYSSIYPISAATGLFNCNAGDTIRVSVFQNSGTTRSVGTVNPNYDYITIQQLF